MYRNHQKHIELNSNQLISPSAAHMRQWIGSALVQIIVVAYSAPSHDLNQCWVIVNWTLRNKPQWNLDQNKKYFIHKDASENIVCDIAAILSSGEMSYGRNPALDIIK